MHVKSSRSAPREPCRSATGGQPSPTRTLRQLASKALVFLLGLLGPFDALDGSAQDFQINGVALGHDGHLGVRFRASADFYYLLLHGTDVGQITAPAAIALGLAGNSELTSPFVVPLAPAAAFYRVRQIPLDAPLDSDSDGIDDVWELRFRNPGAALDHQDPLEDHNGNGVPDLEEVSAPVAAFAAASSTVLANAASARVEVALNRPFHGTLRYAVGGSAIVGVDLAPMNGEVAVNGTTAEIVIPLLPTPALEPERRVVLTLAQPTGEPPPYRLGSPQVHELRLVEGDLGLYFGSFVVTNGFQLGPQPVKLALRSAGNTARAYFDTGRSSFFAAPFEAPIVLGGGDQPFAFTGGATGNLAATALQRALDWHLDFGPVTTDTNGVMAAKFTLELTGLTASGRIYTAEGRLQCTRADP